MVFKERRDPKEKARKKISLSCTDGESCSGLSNKRGGEGRVKKKRDLLT